MRERTLTIGSLFSGIGGLELGLERAGLGPVVWQVEKDAYCRAVLAKHWPDATRYEDVKDVGRANLVPVDVICGGFPCQDISVAGRRAGLAGARSGLWFEFSRIVRELRPRYVVVENVPMLLADGMGVVLGELAAGGYDAEWDCLPACSVGAPHQRDRVFIVAYANGSRQLQPEGTEQDERGWTRDGSPSRVLADADRAGLEGWQRAELPERASEWTARTSSPSVADATCELLHGTRRAGTERRSEDSDRRGWLAEPDVGRVAHGVPARVDRLRALGNAVVPQVAEVVGRVILALEAQQEVA